MANRKTVVGKCKTCGTEFIGYAATKYCSTKCKPDYGIEYRNDPGRLFTYFKSTHDDVSISFDEYWSLKRQPCRYCGDPGLNNVGRIDSSEGFTPENSIPCCSDCNIMKRGNYENWFINHCKKIAEFNSK